MKFVSPIVAAASVALLTFASTGCKHNTKPATEPAPTALEPMAPAPAPAPQAPVVVQPAPPVDSNAALKESGTHASITGHKYTVQKGDTLFNIAQRKYGHGSASNIKKIESANPGLKPQTLKIGQTITLP